jgi:hypothetical protein
MRYQFRAILRTESSQHPKQLARTLSGDLLAATDHYLRKHHAFGLNIGHLAWHAIAQGQKPGK